eukprot:375370-Pleurochrysis_carterae.AAC.1
MTSSRARARVPRLQVDELVGDEELEVLVCVGGDGDGSHGRAVLEHGHRLGRGGRERVCHRLRVRRRRNNRDVVVASRAKVGVGVTDVEALAG